MAGAGRRAVLASAVLFSGLALTAAALADPDPMTYSPNWAGYVATGTAGSPVSYTSVTGTWTVPPATCSDKLAASGSSTAWVGLGGYTTKFQEEVGTDSNCNAQDQPIYYAWFELVPNISFKVFPTTTDKVSPGDTITGLVKSLSIRFVLLQIHDQTAGWTFSRTIDYGQQDITSAEWIVAAPAQCLYFVCSQANLTNFGALTMRNVSVTTSSGTTGTLNDSDWRVIPIQLVPGPTLVPNLSQSDPDAATSQGKQTAASPAGASPGQPSSDGSSFTITWLPVSTKGD
jgi:hypothetical protein